MREHIAGCGSRCRVKREEGGQEGVAGGGEEGEFGADDGADGLRGVREAEGFSVWEPSEGGPGCFGGDAAEFEGLGGREGGLVCCYFCCWDRSGIRETNLGELVHFALALEKRLFGE